MAQLAAAFMRHGIEARHLRMYKIAAEREAGFFEQVVMPLLKQRNPGARQQAIELLDELTELGERPAGRDAAPGAARPPRSQLTVPDPAVADVLDRRAPSCRGGRRAARATSCRPPTTTAWCWSRVLKGSLLFLADLVRPLTIRARRSTSSPSPRTRRAPAGSAW